MWTILGAPLFQVFRLGSQRCLPRAALRGPESISRVSLVSALLGGEQGSSARNS